MKRKLTSFEYSQLEQRPTNLLNAKLMASYSDLQVCSYESIKASLLQPKQIIFYCQESLSEYGGSSRYLIVSSTHYMKTSQSSKWERPTSNQ